MKCPIITADNLDFLITHMFGVYDDCEFDSIPYQHFAVFHFNNETLIAYDKLHFEILEFDSRQYKIYILPEQPLYDVTNGFLEKCINQQQDTHPPFITAKLMLEVKDTIGDTVLDGYRILYHQYGSCDILKLPIPSSIVIQDMVRENIKTIIDAIRETSDWSEEQLQLFWFRVIEQIIVKDPIDQKEIHERIQQNIASILQ